MNDKRLPPPYPEKLIIALFGKRVQLKNSIGKMILKSDTAFVATSDNFVVEKNHTFKIVNTPKIFETEYPHPDQLIIDFMAVTHPGPNLFILAIDQENIQEEKVVDQIKKLQDIFGEKVTANLVVTLPDIESFNSLSHLKYRFNTRLAVASENLASECQKWCSASQAFLYDFKNYSEAVVMKRKAALEKGSNDAHQPHQHWSKGDKTRSLSTSQRAPDRAAAPEHHVDNSACDTWDNIFNIILVGLSGTGKSASANTILSVVESSTQSKHFFKSESNSMPTTTECQCKIVKKVYGRQVRLVDTPDFLNDHNRNSQEQIEECKKYCKPGRCVVLLVMQIGRVTEGETGILEKLENKLGWNISDRTIVLLTHGEDLKEDLQQFIKSNHRLDDIVSQCGYRYHLFKNTSKSPKQVTQLIQKIQNFLGTFPKFAKNKPECCML